MSTVLITGTSSGIGLAAAIHLARAGHRVVATMRNLAKQDALDAAAAAAEVRIPVLALDVTDTESIANTVGAIIDTYGGIDVLLNNAGAAELGTLERVDDVALKRAMEVNFFGPARLTRKLLPHMRARQSGRIVSVTSVGGVVGQPFNDAYCAAKFALEGLMESLAPVARKFGIHVTVLEPGPVASAFVDNARVDDITADFDASDPLDQLLGKYFERARTNFANAQTSEDVAAVIGEILADPEPKFRYQSSSDARQFVGLKMSDFDGARVQELTRKWLE